MGKPIKPLLRYFGGKWNSASWIMEYFPKHRVYVEPYGGAASVLMQKDRCFSECYNDIDSEVVNVFRVLQDRSAREDLKDKLKFTPYARSEFQLAYEPTQDPVEQARRLLIRSWMGHGTGSIFRKTGYRTNVRYTRYSTPADDWVRLIDYLDLFVDRLRGVNIENADAHKVIKGHDCEDCLFYVDPPYLGSTRNSKDYRHEMTEESQHRDLAELLHSIKGMVVLSGYHSSLYDEIYSGWHRVETIAYSDNASERTEVLWISPSAKRALDSRQPMLFSLETETSA